MAENQKKNKKENPGDAPRHSYIENFLEYSPDPVGVTRRVLIEVAEITLFAGKFFRNLFWRPFATYEMVRISFEMGVKSLSLVGITGFIMGLVLTLQSRPVLLEFGAESWLPSMVSVSIIREIGPVVTALILAGKLGSSIGAELGSMRVTEQIEAMEVSGTNPVNYLVVTRVLAATFIVPLLVIYADAIALLGSFVGMNFEGNITLPLYFDLAFDPVHFIDVIPATIKTFVFGFAIGIIGCYKGYYSGLGTRGVGNAANEAVVSASLAIFVIDLIAVQLTNFFS